MLRGNRSIILALVGWLILSASPPQNSGQRQQAEAEQSIANSLERLARASESRNEAAANNPPCEQGKDNRSSDLCAQWKAADAANESATWTRRSYSLYIAGLVIGVLTLGAAAAAAVFAKKAADHTQRSADAAEDSLALERSDSRPKLVPERPVMEEQGPGAIFRLQWRNAGQGPALITGGKIFSAEALEGDVQAWIDGKEPRKPIQLEKAGYVIPAGGAHLSPWARIPIGRNAAYWVYGRVTYRRAASDTSEEEDWTSEVWGTIVLIDNAMDEGVFIWDLAPNGSRMT